MTQIGRAATSLGLFITIGTFSALVVAEMVPSPITPETPWLVVIGVGVVLLATICGLLWWTITFRRLDDDEIDELHGGVLWHITAADLGNDRARLEVARCRRQARMWSRTQPWRRPRRAVYLFTSRPGRSARWMNVLGVRQLTLYELDAPSLPGEVFMRPGDRVLAVPSDVVVIVRDRTVIDRFGR